MLVSVLFAFQFAIVADIQGNLGQSWQIAGILVGEPLERGANGKHLRNARGTGCQFLVSAAQKAEAVV